MVVGEVVDGGAGRGVVVGEGRPEERKVGGEQVCEYDDDDEKEEEEEEDNDEDGKDEDDDDDGDDYVGSEELRRGR